MLADAAVRLAMALALPWVSLAGSHPVGPAG
ncbi:hypothetical protein FMEAI12_1950005 [Parafrankia sp. Ea1.12]|nr:hypothetical protein FMEAI12_1950005 [Parafrankia sp. Ea1.12]